MAKRGNDGCLLIIVVVSVMMLSRCGDDASKTTTATSRYGQPDAAPATSETKYVQSSSANCRSAAKVRAKIVAKLSRGDTVQVDRSDGTWSHVEIDLTPCWVSSQLLADTDSKPVVATTDTYSSKLYEAPSEPRLTKRKPLSSFTCGWKRVCGDMNSCAEAYYYLNQCGLSRLDRDNDGVPCESICG